MASLQEGIRSACARFFGGIFFFAFNDDDRVRLFELDYEYGKYNFLVEAKDYFNRD
jgi:hypothetical protein